MVSASRQKSGVRRSFDRVFGKTAGDRAFHIVNYALFVLFGLVMLYPFLYVLKVSLQSTQAVGGDVRTVYNFAAYGVVLKNADILKAFLLTAFVVVAHTALHVFFTVMSAYPLSKKHFRGRGKLLVFVLFTMLFSGGTIPTYILYTRVLHLRDSILVYIVPGLVTGFNIIIVKNFLQGIPESLEESALLDGANDFVILFKIYVPLSLPIMATIALWAGVGKWNNWMTGVLYISDRDMLLIQNILRNMLIATSATDVSGSGGDKTLLALAENIKMATVIVGTLPIVLVYPFVQKYFIKGVLLGSVKG